MMRYRWQIVRATLGIVVGLGLGTFGFVSGPSPVGASAGTSTLSAGETLNEGQELQSPNGEFSAELQLDGNFVVYGPNGPLWADGLNNFYGPDHLVLQSDGNLVAYLWNDHPMWATGTSQPSGAMLVMQDDGNLVLYNDSSVPLWASGTSQPSSTSPPTSGGSVGSPTPSMVLAQEESSSFTLGRDGGISVLLPNGQDFWIFGDTPEATYGNVYSRTSPSTLAVNQVLNEGQELQSPNGEFSAELQLDGNFVVYGPNGPLWADGLNNFYGPDHLVLQSDGNLVAYLWNDHPMWATGTSQPSGAMLVMQDDGNLVLYNDSSVPLWASGTSEAPILPDKAWNLKGFVTNATAAEQPLARDSVPISLSEVGGDPKVPTQFIPPPTNVYLPDGTGRLCTQSNGALYSARWPNGAVLLSDNHTLLVTYVEACVTPTAFYPVGWGFLEYDTQSNSISQQPIDVFPPATSGAEDLTHTMIGSPVLDASGNVDLFFSSCPGRAESCAGYGTVKVLSIAPTVMALASPSSYDLSSATTLATPDGDQGWLPFLLSVSPVETSGHHYVMVEQESLAGNYTVLTALSPTGPWTAVAVDQPLANCSSLVNQFCYGVNPHPEISDTKLYLSFFDPFAGPDPSFGHTVMTEIPFGG